MMENTAQKTLQKTNKYIKHDAWIRGFIKIVHFYLMDTWTPPLKMSY